MQHEDRDRRRRGGDRRGDRSRSGGRRRRRDEGAAPPAEWHGSAPGHGAPPPSDWRGPPPGYPGHPPHGYMPPPHGYGYPPPRGPYPPMRPPGPEYGWPGHMHPQRPAYGGAEPPAGWPGPAARPAYGGETASAWAQPPAHGPPGWGADAQRAYQPPPGQRPGGEDKPLQHSAPDAQAAPAGGPAAAQTDYPPGDVDDVDDDEDELPPPQTAADRLRGVRLVASALGAGVLARLKEVGVPVDGRPKKAASAALQGGAPEELPGSLASVESQHSRMGLDKVGQQKGRPPPSPGQLRLPACTLGLVHVGLWERFRKICGTPVPAETPAQPCELKASKGGGQVVAPLLLPQGLMG